MENTKKDFFPRRHFISDRHPVDIDPEVDMSPEEAKELGLIDWMSDRTAE